jgi:hypothetical protein
MSQNYFYLHYRRQAAERPIKLTKEASDELISSSPSSHVAPERFGELIGVFVNNSRDRWRHERSHSQLGPARGRTHCAHPFCPRRVAGPGQPPIFLALSDRHWTPA